MSRKGLVLFAAAGLCTGLFLAGCRSSAFEKSDCRFDVPAGVEVECGDVSLPENYSQPGSARVRLHVAIVKAQDPRPARDPLLILSGGPGRSSLDGIDFWLYVFLRVHQDRTIILFDPRGAGYSQPSLNCPEVEAQWQQDWAQDLSIDETDQHAAQALQACRDRLTAQGIDLSSYTTASNAADVKELRRALGYRQWNLYGGAYGSRLALAVMQEDPGGVRSVILDSADPPQLDQYTSQAENLARSVDLLLERCTSDPTCSLAYPDLRGKLYELADNLDRNPVVYQEYDRSTRTNHSFYLNGDRWTWAVSQMFYGTGLAATLPKRISTLERDMTLSFGRDLQQLLSLQTSLSEGAYYSIQCADERVLLIPVTSQDAALNVSPRISRVMDPGRMARDCAIWEENSSIGGNQAAVSSDIPTLILAGELDPIMPPAWGRLAAETLSRSQFLEFPGFGHGVLGGGPDGGHCTMQIVSDFIDDPTTAVDSDCISSLDMGFLSP